MGGGGANKAYGYDMCRARCVECGSSRRKRRSQPEEDSRAHHDSSRSTLLLGLLVAEGRVLRQCCCAPGQEPSMRVQWGRTRQSPPSSASCPPRPCRCTSAERAARARGGVSDGARRNAEGGLSGFERLLRGIGGLHCCRRGRRGAVQARGVRGRARQRRDCALAAGVQLLGRTHGPAPAVTAEAVPRRAAKAHAPSWSSRQPPTTWRPASCPPRRR